MGDCVSSNQNDFLLGSVPPHDLSSLLPFLEENFDCPLHLIPKAPSSPRGGSREGPISVLSPFIHRDDSGSWAFCVFSLSSPFPPLAFCFEGFSNGVCVSFADLSGLRTDRLDGFSADPGLTFRGLPAEGLGDCSHEAASFPFLLRVPTGYLDGCYRRASPCSTRNSPSGGTSRGGCRCQSLLQPGPLLRPGGHRPGARPLLNWPLGGLSKPLF